MDTIIMKADKPLKPALELIWKSVGGPFTIKRIVEKGDAVEVHVQDNLEGYNAELNEKFAKAMEGDIDIQWLSPDANRPRYGGPPRRGG